LGTGFVIGDGSLVVTNAHVLPSETDSKHFEKLTVFVRRDKKNEIIVVNTVAIDKQHDIAILKLSKRRLSPLQLQTSTSELKNRPGGQ
ncbi:MAG: trypsin-like serine protease, partial [Xanthomonadales bacterium]|nr:trypsin-like serine protease [Xanthomonadales bacterium]